MTLIFGNTSINQGGGQTINNQDIKITQDGVYTASEGYTGLGTVTVSTFDSYIMGNFPANINSNVPSVGAYALAYKSAVETITLPNAVSMGSSALSNNDNLTSISLGSFTGSTLDETTGHHDYTGYVNGLCTMDRALTSFSAPNLQIIDDEFFSFINIGNSFTFNAPSLKGITGNAFGSWDASFPSPYQITQNLGIDIADMKLLSIAGDLLEGYIEANSLTDTLTFNNLITMGQGFTNTNRVQRNYLDNITSLVVPNVKCIEDWCELNLPIITLDLPSIMSIGGNALTYCSSLTTINVGSAITEISPTAFINLDGVTINIDLPQPDAGDSSWKANAPWGAINATINWIG